MSDQYAMSATFKASSSFDAPWIVVYANDPEQLADRVRRVRESRLIAEVTSTAVAFRTEEAGVNPSAGKTAAPRRTEQPTEDPGRPEGPAPTCKHGEMEWVNPENQVWQGWFCPQKDSNGKRIRGTGDCKTRWVND